MRRWPALAIAVLVAAAPAGCGLDVQAPDLFAVTRTGEGTPLTMLVNYAGTIRCDGKRPRMLPDAQLLVARDLVGALGADARRHLDLPSPPNSVSRFTVRLQAGTISFPDTATGTHRPLAQLVQFVVQAEPACGAGS